MSYSRTKTCGLAILAWWLTGVKFESANT